MSIVSDLYGIKWGNPSIAQVRNSLILLEEKPAEFTPEHWTRVATDLLRKIGRSAGEQSRMTMPEGLSEDASRFSWTFSAAFQVDELISSFDHSITNSAA